MNEFAFTRFCPGKARTLGQDAFFRAMEYTVTRNSELETRNSELGTRNPKPPRFSSLRVRPAHGHYQEMREVFQYTIERLISRRIPIGVAPNIEVSLVVQPTDTLYLARRDPAFYAYRVYNG